ncbi:MAG: hypothetical protein ACI9AR_000254 [Flavobacteriaceae bacterium]|jgi:hypothetical protein
MSCTLEVINFKVVEEILKDIEKNIKKFPQNQELLLSEKHLLSGEFTIKEYLSEIHKSLIECKNKKIEICSMQQRIYKILYFSHA